MANKVRGCAVFAFVKLAQLVAAEPGAAAPAHVNRTQLSGEAVLASFDQTSQDGCVRTVGTVFANESESRTSGATDRLISLTLIQRDLCKLEILVEGFGTSTEFQLTSARNLSSATLVGALNFTNVVDGSVLPVTLDLSLKAVDGRIQTVTSDAFKQEGAVFSSSTIAAARNASAQGTVTVGDDVLLEGAPSFKAIIATGLERSTTVATP